MKKTITLFVLLLTKTLLPNSQNLYHQSLAKTLLITSGLTTLSIGTYYANKWGGKRFAAAYKKQNKEDLLYQKHFFKRSLRNILTIITGADTIKNDYKPFFYKIWSKIPGSKYIEQYSGVSSIIPPFIAQRTPAGVSSTPEPISAPFYSFTESATHPESYVMNNDRSPVHIPYIQTTIASMLDSAQSQKITKYAFAICNRSCSERPDYVYCLLTQLETNTVYLTFLTDNPLYKNPLLKSQESTEITRVKDLLDKNTISNYSTNLNDFLHSVDIFITIQKWLQERGFAATS